MIFFFKFFIAHESNFKCENLKYLQKVENQIYLDTNHKIVLYFLHTKKISLIFDTSYYQYKYLIKIQKENVNWLKMKFKEIKIEFSFDLLRIWEYEMLVIIFFFFCFLFEVHAFIKISKFFFSSFHSFYFSYKSKSIIREIEVW